MTKWMFISFLEPIHPCSICGKNVQSLLDPDGDTSRGVCIQCAGEAIEQKLQPVQTMAEPTIMADDPELIHALGTMGELCLPGPSSYFRGKRIVWP